MEPRVSFVTACVPMFMKESGSKPGAAMAFSGCSKKKDAAKAGMYPARELCV